MTTKSPKLAKDVLGPSAPVNRESLAFYQKPSRQSVSLSSNPAMASAFDDLLALTKSAGDIQDTCKENATSCKRIRRKSKELENDLQEIHESLETLADASKVFQALGGFKRNRRNSKDLSDDTLRLAFAEIDKDGSGCIDRDELTEALVAQNANLKPAQIEQLITMADTNGDGEIDFEEYKAIMSYSSGVPTGQ